MKSRFNQIKKHEKIERFRSRSVQIAPSRGGALQRCGNR